VLEGTEMIMNRDNRALRCPYSTGGRDLTINKWYKGLKKWTIAKSVAPGFLKVRPFAVNVGVRSKGPCGTISI